MRDGYVPDHLCQVRHCITPEHLEEVTQAENARRVSDRMETCQSGKHKWVPENWMHLKSGHKRCKPCAQEASKERHQRTYTPRKRKKKPIPATCQAGHALVGNNLVITPKRWACRECGRKASRKYARGK